MLCAELHERIGDSDAHQRQRRSGDETGLDDYPHENCDIEGNKRDGESARLPRMDRFGPQRDDSTRTKTGDQARYYILHNR